MLCFVYQVEFLKAQLAAEQESSEELKKAIAVGKQKQEEFKDEFRLRMKVRTAA